MRELKWPLGATSYILETLAPTVFLEPFGGSIATAARSNGSRQLFRPK